MNVSPAVAHGRRSLFGVAICALICTATHAAPAPTPPLPEPLTLDYALSLADEPDPALQQAQAGVALAAAQQEDAASGSGTRAALQGHAFRVDPSPAGADQGRDDSNISLVISKPLFDFGRTRASLAAAQAEFQGSQMRLLDAHRQRRLNIMARYFDVLLADLAFARDDAARTVANHACERAQASQQLGQISLMALRATQARCLDAKRQQLASDAQRRATRRALANSLNHSGQLPATLSAPQLADAARAVPEADAVLTAAQSGNPRFLAQRAQVEAARQRVQAARAQRLPVLNGELAASDYSRQTDERDDWRAGVTLEIPLYSGGKTHAAIAMRQAELQQVEAEYQRAQQTLEQSVHAVLDEIAGLRIQREQAVAQLESRDMALERSRGSQAAMPDDGGEDVTVQVADARLFKAQTDYQLALAWERLDALLGAAAEITAAPETNAGQAVSQPLNN